MGKSVALFYSSWGRFVNDHPERKRREQRLPSFIEDPIPPCGVVHRHMGHGADELAVLDDGGAGHE